KGDNSLAVNGNDPLTSDQRGFPRISLGIVDVGAFEAFAPLAYKQLALARIPAASTGDAATDSSFQSARSFIQQSLSGAYFVDDFHLSNQGGAVFTAEAQAANCLLKIVAGNGPFAGVAKQVLDALAEADYGLAQVAINQAEATPGCNKSKLNT